LAPLRNGEWVVYSKRPFGGPARGTGPGYCSCAAEKAHVRFARDQLRGA